MAVADDSLRPVLPDMLHPGLMDLLQACFSSEPEQRPSFAMVRPLGSFAPLLGPALPAARGYSSPTPESVGSAMPTSWWAAQR